MGYTHYYYQKPKLAQKKFNEFSEVVVRLLSSDDAKNILVSEMDREDKPNLMVDNQAVKFNGIGVNSHESFWFLRQTEMPDYQKSKGRNKVFNFCKTARKPYDKYVVACLIIAKSIFGKDIEISSDGDLEDWNEGKKLVENNLNSTVTLGYIKEEIQVDIKVNETSVEDFIKDIGGDMNVAPVVKEVVKPIETQEVKEEKINEITELLG